MVKMLAILRHWRLKMILSNQLNLIFQQVFDDDAIQITPEMTANDIEGWDSLSHINLILAIEQHFKIKFNQKEVLRFRNIGDMATCIESKIG